MKQNSKATYDFEGTVDPNPSNDFECRQNVNIEDAYDEVYNRYDTADEDSENDGWQTPNNKNQ